MRRAARFFPHRWSRRRSSASILGPHRWCSNVGGSRRSDFRARHLAERAWTQPGANLYSHGRGFSERTHVHTSTFHCVAGHCRRRVRTKSVEGGSCWTVFNPGQPSYVGISQQPVGCRRQSERVLSTPPARDGTRRTSGPGRRGVNAVPGLTIADGPERL